MVAPLPLSTHVALERMLEGAGLGEYMSETDRRQQNITGIRLSQESPVDWTPSATVQRSHMVRDDAVTRPSDLEEIFNAIGTQVKLMLGIDNTTSRWDGHM